jgi:hypothetical protein
VAVVREREVAGARTDTRTALGRKCGGEGRRWGAEEEKGGGSDGEMARARLDADADADADAEARASASAKETWVGVVVFHK